MINHSLVGDKVHDKVKAKRAFDKLDFKDYEIMN